MKTAAMLTPRTRRFALIAAAIALSTSVALAQTAELKNVQFFKGASRDQIVWTMGFITQSLGVTCDYCHVRAARGFEFDRDDKESKRTARRMLTMMKSINDQFFDGQQRVTCATCHEGQPQPQKSNPFVTVEMLQAKAAALRQANGKEPLPPAAALLAKYEQAIGGAAALAKLTTSIEEFSQVDPTGIGTGETVQKAPNKWIETTDVANRPSTWSSDGTSAHITSPAGTTNVTGLDLEYVQLIADFWRTLKLTDRYSKAETSGKEIFDGAAVYVVDGVVKDSNVKERLFFDVNSGLLLRRHTFTPTLLGPQAEQTDFEDYRTAGDIKVPFVVKSETGAFARTRTYSSIRFNVPVDDAKFSTSVKTPSEAH